MPAVTDLTWGDLDNGIKKLLGTTDGGFIFIDTNTTPRKLCLDISALIPGAADDLGSNGTYN